MDDETRKRLNEDARAFLETWKRSDSEPEMKDYTDIEVRLAFMFSIIAAIGAIASLVMNLI